MDGMLAIMGLVVVAMVWAWVRLWRGAPAIERPLLAFIGMYVWVGVALWVVAIAIPIVRWLGTDQ